jgi:hypothetical protein
VKVVFEFLGVREVIVFEDADVEKDGFIHTPRVDCDDIFASMCSEKSPEPTTRFVTLVTEDDNTIIFEATVKQNAILTSNCRKETKTPFRANVEVKVRSVARKD